MTHAFWSPTGVDAMLALAAVPAASSGIYLARLALAARPMHAPAPLHDVRFDVVVPAHNEEHGIAATVTSLLALDYPRDRFRVVVVADNCTDRTADVARAAGATVIVREDLTQRGKGFALARAYELLLAEQRADAIADAIASAIVVVDADTVVSPNLLSAFAARIAQGAECLQAEYAVRNSGDSWRTRLMSIAFALYHTTRSLGRERLALSCGLRGNGMCFTTGVLRRVPHRAFSVVEDVEYGIDLGLAGVRVWYVPEATVRGEMPATAEASRSQRQRWEKGRAQLVRQRRSSLARASFGAHGRIAFDLLADLLVPPLTRVVAMTVIGAALAAAGIATGASGGVGAAGWVIAALMLGVYIGRGCVLSGAGPRVVLDLLYAPVYATWKLTLLLRPSVGGRGEWIRTRRANDNASV